MREETRRILLKINGQIHFGLAREGPVVAVKRRMAIETAYRWVTAIEVGADLRGLAADCRRSAPSRHLRVQ